MNLKEHLPIRNKFIAQCGCDDDQVCAQCLPARNLNNRDLIYRCPTCGVKNQIVNQCGRDPNNLPTRSLVTGEIETHLGKLPLSLIDEIHERRRTIYHGLDYRPDVVARLKADFDYLMAFVIALRPTFTTSTNEGKR